MTYVGLISGANKGEYLDLSSFGGVFSDSAMRKSCKVLDTSVIIDGRVADICKTGFLEGTLVVPHFVLRELQQIADSADSAKRNRGRRGLDVLEKIKSVPGVAVQIVEKDYPGCERGGSQADRAGKRDWRPRSSPTISISTRSRSSAASMSSISTSWRTLSNRSCFPGKP